MAPPCSEHERRIDNLEDWRSDLDKWRMDRRAEEEGCRSKIWKAINEVKIDMAKNDVKVAAVVGIMAVLGQFLLQMIFK